MAVVVGLPRRVEEAREKEAPEVEEDWAPAEEEEDQEEEEKEA